MTNIQFSCCPISLSPPLLLFCSSLLTSLPNQRHNDQNSLAQSTYVFLYTLFVCRDEWQNSKKNLEATSETAINTQLKQGGFPNSLDSLTLTDVCGHSASGSTDLFLLLHKRQSTMNSLIHFKMKLLSKLNDFE